MKNPHEIVLVLLSFDPFFLPRKLAAYMENTIDLKHSNLGQYRQ